MKAHHSFEVYRANLLWDQVVVKCNYGTAIFTKNENSVIVDVYQMHQLVASVVLDNLTHEKAKLKRA